MNQPDSLITTTTREEPNSLYLDPQIRAFLSETICLRVDLKEFARLCLWLALEKRNAQELLGNCPYCQRLKSFHLNQQSGASHCTACGRKQDLFTLINEQSKPPSALLSSAFNWLRAYCEFKAEERSAHVPAWKERV